MSDVTVTFVRLMTAEGDYFKFNDRRADDIVSELKREGSLRMEWGDGTVTWINASAVWKIDELLMSEKEASRLF